MKLTEIEIKRFGVWRDLRLPIEHGGLTAVYGPNEAGKTTLKRFVRGALYGGVRPTTRTPEGCLDEQPWEGTLRVAHGGRPCEIRLAWHPDGRRLVSVTGVDRQAPSEELLGELVAQTRQDVFENVFAIGLTELQELATLNGEAVAQHVYDLSLGPDGRRLLSASNTIKGLTTGLFDADARSGELVDLCEDRETLDAELAAHAAITEQHARLCVRRRRLSDAIDDRKRRQEGLRSQLQGHVFLKRVWEPWRQVRDCEDQLAALPSAPAFPENGLSQLDALDQQITQLEHRHATTVREADELRNRAATLQLNSAFARQAAGLQAYVDQRPWLVSLAAKAHESGASATRLRKDLDTQLKELGADWSLARLAKVDASPAAQAQMIATAREYRSVLSQWSRFRRRYRNLARIGHQRTLALNDRIKSLGGLSINEALRAARGQQEHLDGLSALRMREAELSRRHRAAVAQIKELEERLALPQWVYIMLAFFGVMGIACAIVGIVLGIRSNAIAGAIYVLLGITSGGVAWALRRHFERAIDDSLDDMEEDAIKTQAELREVRREIQLITGDREKLHPLPSADGEPPQPAGAPQPTAEQAATTSELIAGGLRRLAEIEQLAVSHERVKLLRRKLTELRGQFSALRRRVGDARQTWCVLLTKLGLSETVRIDEAFAVRQQILATDDARRNWASAEQQWSLYQEIIDVYRGRVLELDRAVRPAAVEQADWLAILDNWRGELDKHRQAAQTAGELVEAESKLRKQVAGLQSELEEHVARRRTLFVKAGAANADEFRERAAWAASRREFAGLLALAKTELDAAAKTEPDLAIVEEDLDAFDAARNEACIEAIESEIQDLDGDLAASYEELGRLKRDMEDMESDRSAARLRSRRVQNAERLRAAAQQWVAMHRVRGALDRVREKFERTRQSATLSRASRYLEQLTRGRYANLWTPLGERSLRVDDDRGRTFRVEEMSGGACEQLFLAIRLSIIREFADRGIELPVVLDDVLVNFDRPRTEAALDTLLQFAADGQQILLFTCHEHLVDLLAQRGVGTLRLPEHHPQLAERRAG